MFLVGVGLAGVFVVTPDLLGISNLPSLQFSILLIGTLVYLAIFSAYFRAAKRIFASQFYMQVLRTILLMSGLAAILLLGNELELTQAIAVTALSALVALIFLLIHFYFMMKKVMPTKTTALNKPRSMDTERDWLHLGGPVFLIAIVQQLTSQGNIILIGNLIGSDAAGQYAAAFRLANFIPFALLAIGAIAAPMIATAYRREDKKELQRIATISARIAFLAGAGLGGVFVLFGKPILLLFGPDFVPAYGALIVLSIANIVNAGTGVAGYYLLMTGHQMQALYFGVFCLLLNVTLALVLIPQMGLLGGATAAAIGLAAFNVLQYMFVRKKMGIDSSVFGGSKSEKQI